MFKQLEVFERDSVLCQYWSNNEIKGAVNDDLWFIAFRVLLTIVLIVWEQIMTSDTLQLFIHKILRTILKLNLLSIKGYPVFVVALIQENTNNALGRKHVRWCIYTAMATMSGWGSKFKSENVFFPPWSILVFALSSLLVLPRNVFIAFHLFWKTGLLRPARQPALSLARWQLLCKEGKKKEEKYFKQSLNRIILSGIDPDAKFSIIAINECDKFHWNNLYLHKKTAW